MVQEARPSCGADEQSSKQLLSVSRAHRLHRGGEAVPWLYLLGLTSYPRRPYLGG